MNSRSEFIKKISDLKGQTTLDKERHLPAFLNQMFLDVLQIVDFNLKMLSELRALNGFEELNDALTKVNQMEESLNLLKKMKQNFDIALLMTGHKTKTEWLESVVFKAKDYEYQKIAEAHEKMKINDNGLMNDTTQFTLPKKTDFDFIREISLRIITPTKVSEQDREPEEAAPITNFRRSTRSTDMPNQDIILMTRKHGEIKIPPPSGAQNLYTMKELGDLLLPYKGKGLKHIVEELKRTGKITFSSTCFMSHLNKNESIPSQIVVRRGRRPLLDKDK